jgi:hypothetical protein
MSLTIDSSQFTREFKKLNDKFIGKYGDEAIMKAAFALRFDAEDISPTVPKKIGTLRSEVKFKPVSSRLRKGVDVVWTQKYAARLHYAPKTWKFSEPGSGPDYVESKLRTRGQKYLAVMGLVYKSKQ